MAFNYRLGDGYSRASEVLPTTPIQSGQIDPVVVTSGAPSSSFSAPSSVSVPNTLDVVVLEGMLLSNGDDVDSGLQSGDYVDNRGAGTAWQNIQAALSSDDNYTTVELAGDASSQELFLQGFNFNLAVDAELLGLEVIVERSVVRGSIASDTAGVGHCEFVSPGPPFDYTSDIYWTSSDATFSGGVWTPDVSPPTQFAFVLTPAGGWNTTPFCTSYNYIDITYTFTASGTRRTQFGVLGNTFGTAGVKDGPYLSPGTVTITYDMSNAADTLLYFYIYFESYTSFSVDSIVFTDVDNAHQKYSVGE